MMTASERAAELNGLYNFYLTTEEAHWAEYGIHTSEQLDEYLNICAEANAEEYSYPISEMSEDFYRECEDSWIDAEYESRTDIF